MTAPTVPLAFAIANNQTIEHQFTLAVGGDAGNIVTGSKIHMTVRPDPESQDVILDASVENGMLVVNDAPAGLVTLLVHAWKMRQIKAGSYVYDLIVERPTGRVYRLFAGDFDVSHGITAPTVTTPVT